MVPEKKKKEGSSYRHGDERDVTSSSHISTPTTCPPGPVYSRLRFFCRDVFSHRPVIEEHGDDGSCNYFPGQEQREKAMKDPIRHMLDEGYKYMNRSSDRERERVAR